MAPAPLAAMATPASQRGGSPRNPASPTEPAQTPGRPAHAAVFSPARPSPCADMRLAPGLRGRR
eukprot:13111748-Alexandrium_andersonii.AAC.1